MVWVAVCYRKRPRVFYGKKKYKGYIRLVESEILPYGKELSRENWIFQQIESAIHTAIGVKNLFPSNKILVLPWPDKRTD